MGDKTILVVGTYDTKADELDYLANRIRKMGGAIKTMDVSVLGDPKQPTDYSKHDVALAADSSIQQVIDSGDENTAMQIMARGASNLALRLCGEGVFDGIILLGGTMGTDLALDVCAVLPLGVPKYIVSTVSFSPLIPPERLAVDVQMILWAGGLYGLNPVCKSSLSQAAGAVLGAARAVEKNAGDRPMVGMTSLGSSCLSYMKILKPELEQRGFDVAIFHSTGMGGMAFESMAREGKFVCVMDFCQQELANLLAGSVVHSGADRLLGAGEAGVPQIVAPGCIDLMDFAGWQDIPQQYQDRAFHAHNRLIKSSGLSIDEKRETARELLRRLQQAKGPTHFILPMGGLEEWDRPGGPTHDPDGLKAFIDEILSGVEPTIGFSQTDAHINDSAFAEVALSVFDNWTNDGTIASP